MLGYASVVWCSVVSNWTLKYSLSVCLDFAVVCFTWDLCLVGFDTGRYMLEHEGPTLPVVLMRVGSF